MNSQQFKVLVAGTDPERRSKLSKSLAASGYEVQQAAHGIETVVMALAWEPHVIVATHDLGNMSITEVADRLERASIHHAMVVLGSRLQHAAEQQNGARFYASVNNPEDTEQLRRIVHAATFDIQRLRRGEPEKPASPNPGEVLFGVRFGMTVEEVERLLIQHTLKRLPPFSAESAVTYL